MSKIYLGGTCNGSNWRARLITMLDINYFNPVVPDWTPECMSEELRQRRLCDLCLYVVTPKMTGTYTIAEAVDDSNKRPDKTVFAMLISDGGATFDAPQWKSLNAVASMVQANGAKVFTDLKKVAEYVNNTPKI